ncbi:hypothetical protein KFE80_02790 [bacterium SCSIO 12696]|nr:hypothetical protein KFE80_02790 [bacterium SCSIO 12696]
MFRKKIIVKTDDPWQQLRLGTLLVGGLVIGWLYFLQSWQIHATWECWQASDIWLYADRWDDPFYQFGLVFILMLLWSLGEWLSSLVKKRHLLAIISFSLIAFLSVINFVHYRHWQFLQLQRGYISLEESPYKFEKPSWLDITPYSGKYTSWKDFVELHRCEKGLPISAMTAKEKSDLNRKYVEYRAQEIQLDK